MSRDFGERPVFSKKSPFRFFSTSVKGASSKSRMLNVSLLSLSFVIRIESKREI